jgi:tRNA (adenine57-N1/adenine58-N1)-methyltransferase catalytic subunit
MSALEAVDKAVLQAGEAVLFIDRKDREYLRTLKPGARVHLRRGTVQADELIGQPEGRVVQNSAQEPFLLLRPTYAHLIPNLPRRAQVIYPKDIGPILLWGDIYPGATVIEVGTGPGAMTMALLRAVGSTGRVISYEARAEFAEMAGENVHRFHGAAENWTVRIGDAFEGFQETGVDRMVVDLAEPWHLLEHAAHALRLGGVLVSYVPTVLQVKQQVDALRAHGGFARVEVMESLLRFWHVQNRSVRPEHRMVAHTGFIVVSHRVEHAPRIERPADDEEAGPPLDDLDEVD